MAVHELGLGLDLGGVRRSDVRLGHRERREDFRFDERLQITLAPFVGGVEVEHDRVLQGVGAEGHHRVLRPADDLVDVHVVEERQSAAADLLRMPEGPEILLLRLIHQIADDLEGLGSAFVELRLDGVDALLDEVQDLLPDGFDVLGNRERQRHRGMSSLRSGNSVSTVLLV
jgi:hypothetical protein